MLRSIDLLQLFRLINFVVHTYIRTYINTCVKVRTYMHYPNPTRATPYMKAKVFLCTNVHVQTGQPAH